ncbi:MAG: DEAD/DEAH box helicase [Nitrospiraceae bacterium]|uniref:DEAD/DEAH box helicase n=1 Tax=Nitrospira cf. moscoviensis SBR1015 TaxID=96242 RepID=UPI00111F440C|nr:DEAD/DEAH box helicase [Nitrospira cf. moscoviensis SBR1015]MBY0246208.1 DEAD/DEAH box helicase [Nitrospiraceae bacterium]
MSTKHDSTQEPTAPAATGFSPGFAALGLEASLLATLDALGYEEPTPIQREAVPPLLAGKDLLGQAATGTGKTAAFALPLLQRIAHGVKQRPAALILVPTRELAIQVGEAVQRYGKELRISVLALYGGQAISPQFHALKRGVDVVVATPGRALDHIRRQTLKLAHVQTVVLDEADEMLDMGFADDLDAILLQTPATKQTALFSATMPPRIKSIAHRHLKHPVEITIAKEPVKAGTAPKVQQTAYVVARQHRGAALARILDVAGPKSALVFCRTRVEVDEVTAMLNGRGRRAEAIHGGMSQQQRDRVMSAFRSGQTELLVATDVAARGLDIPHVSHVINFDLPSSAEVYVHRIGRTGRAGREGVAITILDPREQRLLRSIEMHTKSKVVVAQVPSVADLRATRLERTKAAVKEILDAGELEPFLAVAEALAEAGRPIEVAAAAMKLIHRAQGGEQSEQEITGPLSRAPEPYRPQPRSAPYQAARHSSGDRPGRLIMRPGTRPPAGRTTQSAGEPGMARLYVGAGRESGIRPGDLVGAIANEAKVNAGVIGAIEIEERFSIVDVPAGMAKGILEALSRSRIKGRKVPVRVFKD